MMHIPDPYSRESFDARSQERTRMLLIGALWAGFASLFYLASQKRLKAQLTEEFRSAQQGQSHHIEPVQQEQSYGAAPVQPPVKASPTPSFVEPAQPKILQTPKRTPRRQFQRSQRPQRTLPLEGRQFSLAQSENHELPMAHTPAEAIQLPRQEMLPPAAPPAEAIRLPRQAEKAPPVPRKDKPVAPAAPVAASVPPVVAEASMPAKNAHPKRRIVLITSCAILLVLVAVSTLLTAGAYWHPANEAKSATENALLRPDLQRGIVAPRWFNGGYSEADGVWQKNILTIRTQTASQWIEIPIMLTQPTSGSTQVGPSASTVSVDSFVQGVQAAHTRGYKVFFVPLMRDLSKGGWSGSVKPAPADQQTWFDNYWAALLPYTQAAQENHVEQMAVGTELQWLQEQAPDALWNQLIARAHNVFHQSLTYDMNWSSLEQIPRDWLENSNLSYLGVSDYIPLTDTPAKVDPKTIPGLWHDKVRMKLDALSSATGKRVLITELGFRSTSDALYQTWEPSSSAPADPQLQAIALDAAFSNSFADPAIAGVYVWGWSEVGQFGIENMPAVQTLYSWYTRSK